MSSGPLYIKPSPWPEPYRWGERHKPILRYYSGLGWTCYAFGFAGTRPYTLTGIALTPLAAYASAMRQVAEEWEKYFGFRTLVGHIARGVSLAAKAG